MKRFSKLFTSAALLLIAGVLVITASFAWFTLSESPVLQGIRITVSGSDSVMVAPDIAVKHNGRDLHYPGSFADHMNFSQFSQYAFLDEAAGLVPVSTADGLTWYLPTYYQAGDAEVAAGTAFVGQLRPTTEFAVDTMLVNANLSADDADKAEKGSYLYLDFWVVTPLEGYTLRVSTGSESAGSYVIDLPGPEETVVDGQTAYLLTDVDEQAAACMRVGFLVNQDTVLDDSMLLYTQSEQFDSAYTKLQGVYAEQGCSPVAGDRTHFTIYEPNGDMHPSAVYTADGGLVQDGQYAITEPLGNGGLPASVADRLTVQLASRWITAGEETMIAQMFRTFTAGRDLKGETALTLKQKFYEEWMQYQLYPYIQRGKFITRTAQLYAAATDRLLSQQELEALPRSGATTDAPLTPLNSGVPQRIRLFVWLEGQDVDCVNAAAAGSFTLNLELACSNAS